MSSYRSSYIPWQGSLSSNQIKSNSKDRYATSTNSRYSPRTSSYGASSHNANRTSSDTSSASPSNSSTMGSYQQTYRKNATPSILKKYSNFSLPTAVDKNADARRSSNNDKQETKDSTKTTTSSIPRCRPFTKLTPYESATESQGLRYGSSSRFGSQIARSPIKEKALPVFGVSTPVCRRSESKERSPEKTLLVTRATSPTPPSNSSFLRSRRMDNDDVLLSEIFKTTGNHSCRQSVASACQTEEIELNKAPTPPSRVASLGNKFTSIGNSSGGGRYQPKVNSYRCTRPTDLPIRSSSLMRSAYHSPTERASPNDGNVERSSFTLHPSYNPSVRTPSPLAALNKSLSALALENSKSQSNDDDDDSDTENESSYEEDYPIKNENEGYSFISNMVGRQNTPANELSDKPPKYPLSPNYAKSKTMLRDGYSGDARIANVRALSSASSGRLDSSCDEDASEQNSCSDKYIPLFTTFDDNNNNIRSGTMTPQERDDSKTIDNGFGYRIRKIDSADSPWWCKTPDSESLSECNQERCSRFVENRQPSDHSRSTGGDASETGRSFGYAIRKMDSADSPWWCNSEEDTRSSNNQTHPTRSTADGISTLSNYKIRKMDSSEVLWSCNSESSNKTDPTRSVTDRISSNDENLTGAGQIRKFDSGEIEWGTDSDQRVETNSTPSIPEWWNGVKSDDEADGCVENYKTNKILRVKKIELVEKPDKNDTLARQSETNLSNGYKITKIDSGDEAWWLNEGKPEAENTGNSFESRDKSILEEENENNNSFSEYNYKSKYINELDNLLLYIGDHTNIDELLGTEVPPPAAPVTPTGDDSSSEDELGEDCTKVTAREVKIHDGSAYTSTIQRRNYQLDDAALQLYKDGDYSSYLDLDSSISEQQEEFEGFQPSRKDSIIMRTQLSVRVHLIIEKLMKSEGRELRRALFSLKQIFQEDKDLVHEFVQNDGLDCLIKVGSDVDQNYQNYILRALGQVMLYVDGMNGVMEHNPTIQWLYSLVSSKFRLVVKTALKLLLVFVEYVESNCLLLIQAIHTLNITQGNLPWSNIMRLLHEYDATDTELLIYAMTLVNKTLKGIPDQDMYYDQVDLLEEQDMESVIRKYMSKPGTDLDLLTQFQIYEAVLQYEDGVDKDTPIKQLDETIRKTLRNRKSLTNGSVNNDERRKSRRHSTGTTALSHTTSLTLTRHYSETSSPEEYRIKPTADGAGVTPGLRRRRERAERQRSLLREQYENNMRALMDTTSSEDGLQNGNSHDIPHVYVNSTVNKLESMEDNCIIRSHQNGEVSPTLRREATVKDITQKLATLQTPDDSNKSQNIGRVEEMKGIISKAMEGLAKSQSRCDILRSPTSESSTSQIPLRATEPKKSETDLHWEELLATSTRILQLCDLDFSDLKSDDEHDVLAPTSSAYGVPPPPPPCGVPPPVPSISKVVSNKGKKTVKLFWKEVREDPIVMTKLNSKQLIWDEMFPVSVDTQRLEHLFESRAKDLITKKQHELNKNKEIIVLDPKRSNAINIGMTKLPPPRSIKTAILKMDSTVMNREGIEKLLTMLPTEEERSKIQEAQAANPDLPLGTAEHFLLTLASISELTARLKLWAFKLNYENIEKEIADPLMDLKQGMEVLRTNKTFRAILSTLLSIGIFLNGAEVKGFHVEYLSKVPEVKDTVHKHSLLHHLCHIVMEKFPDSTDLYSEIGAVTRASRVDFDDLAHSIQRVEQECKASFDHLKAVAKHDGNAAVKLRISDFLADCAERIIALGKIHRRVLNRFYKFCLWLGIPLHRIQATKPNELCKIISEFALEYRTTRERVIQQLEKKASHRERNKTRGKMITEVGKFKSKEDRQDAELRQLLGKEHGPEQDKITNLQCGSLPWRRLRKDSAFKSIRDQNMNGHLTDADDELLETLVKTATKTPSSRNVPRERKRTRHSDRKSLRRTLKNGLTEEERNHLTAFIKSY